MKRLFINRHAKSDWIHTGLNDSERPLNKRGLHDAPMMGRRLAERNEAIDIIISSPANRAITTAKLIAKELDYPIENIVEESTIYEARVSDLLKIINNIDSTYNNVMLFGHNPGFTDLADYLTGAGVLNIPTCGICKISFNIDTWSQVSAHTGNMDYFDFPKREVVKQGRAK